MTASPSTGGSGGEGHPLLGLDPQSPVGRITLDRPQQRNALSRSLLARLLAALDACAASDRLRVVILAADGPAFSAGHDLRELSACSPAEVEETFTLCARTMLRLQEIPQPVIARVQGIATAAGCQLVAASDLAVASEAASFATPGVNIGLFCSTPAVPLVRSIGRKRALEMLFTGDAIDAPTALAWGLVNRVVPANALDAEVERLAERIASRSAAAIASGKRTFYRQLAMPEDDAYDVASPAMCADLGAEDAREGIAAFLGKRSPLWKRG